MKLTGCDRVDIKGAGYDGGPIAVFNAAIPDLTMIVGSPAVGLTAGDQCAGMSATGCDLNDIAQGGHDRCGIPVCGGFVSELPAFVVSPAL